MRASPEGIGIDTAGATGDESLARSQMFALLLTALPLLLLTHGAILTLGLESPSAPTGAILLLAFRQQAAPLKRLPLPVLLATGAGAGLGITFHSVWLVVTNTAERLCRRRSAALINATLRIKGRGGVLVNAGPCRRSPATAGA